MSLIYDPEPIEQPVPKVQKKSTLVEELRSFKKQNKSQMRWLMLLIVILIFVAAH